MGYTTEFKGEFKLDRPLSHAHKAYLTRFSETRRMKRVALETSWLPDPLREAVGLPVGVDGAFYVGDKDEAGQTRSADIVDYNEPPNGQPGLWCKWIPNETGTALEWDGREKFYFYVEWLEYLIRNFLAPWGYTVNGTVEFQGEAMGDHGFIVVENNTIKGLEQQ
jgi:hypothetical protein